MRPRQRSVEAQRSPQQKGEPWRGITRPAASAARRRPGTPRRGQSPCPGARRCASGSAPVEAVWIEAAHPKGTSCVRGSEPGGRTSAAGATVLGITAGQGHPGEIRDRRLPRPPPSPHGVRSTGGPRAGQRLCYGPSTAARETGGYRERIRGLWSGLGIREFAAIGDRRDVARAMNDAHNDQLAGTHEIVDRVFLVERDPQAGCKMLALRAAQRKALKRLKRAAECMDEVGGYALRGFGGDRCPDFDEVGFRRLRQTEDERRVNSSLPRLMIRAGSKSPTRPAATSASPLSMSALRASSS